MANASTPVVGSLTMELIPRSYRTFYASAVSVVQSLAQIITGIFAKLFIFNRANGYANAYYFAGFLYIIAQAMLLGVFAKKYNKPLHLQDSIRTSEQI